MERAVKFAFYRVFSSHMVLQRERPVVLSGTAEPGRTVRVDFAGLTREAAADQDREWRGEFPAMAAGGPYSITLSGAEGVPAVTLEDVLIGEVWMCSGQSNMEMPVFSEAPFWFTANAAEEVRNADHPQLRLFNAIPTRQLAPEGPLKDENGSGWVACTPETVGDFSACGYFFGRRLQQDLNVPVGLISASWGGTGIEAWISREKFEEKHWQPFRDDPGDEAQAWEELTRGALYRKLLDWLEMFDRHCGQPDAAELTPEFDDSNWKEAPKTVIQLGRTGRFLCRMSFELPPEMVGQDLLMELGVVNDVDRTYFNGEEIGATGAETPSYWSVNRKYVVPAHCLRPGRNCVAVVADNHYSCGQIPTRQLIFSNAESRQVLQPESRWRTIFELEETFPLRPDVPALSSRGVETPNYPSTLFNAMLYPWFRYAVRGVIWYQGCHNNGEYIYYPLHKMLIEDMREHWNDPEMPFLLVQLAAFYAHQPADRLADSFVDNLEMPEYPPYALTREIQAEMPYVFRNVGMITAFDRGDHSDVHPRDKQTLGARLARKAEAMVYQLPVVADGPEFAGCRRELHKMRVFFRNTGSGLTTTDGRPPIGFVLGDRNGNLCRAEAEIDGDTVLVSCDSVPEPERVRYAFTNYCRVNLINKEGFPALPFRSDKVDYEKMFV